MTRKRQAASPAVRYHAGSPAAGARAAAAGAASVADVDAGAAAGARAAAAAPRSVAKRRIALATTHSTGRGVQPGASAFLLRCGHAPVAHPGGPAAPGRELVQVGGDEAFVGEADARAA